MVGKRGDLGPHDLVIQIAGAGRGRYFSDVCEQISEISAELGSKVLV